MFDKINRKVVILLIIAAVIFIVLYAGVAEVQAQENRCGPLSTKECAILSKSVNEWNERFGSHARVVSVTEVSEIDGERLGELIDGILGEPQWVPRQGEEPLLLEPRLVSLNENVDSDAYGRWKSELENFVGSAKNTVKIQWETNSEKFETTAILSEQWPYLYDTMLSNVIRVEETNSCKHIRLLWIWGGIRGEILIELVSQMNLFGSKWCDTNYEAWMRFGQVKINMSDVQYDEHTCRSKYAWAWATPLAKIGFDEEGFKFSIDGLGSHGTGGGSCTL